MTVVASYRALIRALTTHQSVEFGHQRRAAIEAATAAFHFREHLPSVPPWAEVERQCPAYWVVADVANAAKHGRPDRKTPHGQPRVRDISEVFEMATVTQYRDVQGVYHHLTKAVKFRHDGQAIDVSVATGIVVNYWGHYLVERGLLNAFNPESPPVHDVPVTRSEANHASWSGSLYGGIHQGLAVVARRYDGPSRTFEILDPGSLEIVLSVSGRRHYRVDFTRPDGLPALLETQLTDDQQSALERLPPEQHESFLQALPQVRTFVDRFEARTLQGGNGQDQVAE
jgi:hypothetical protein